MATFALCCGLMSDQSELCYSLKMPSTKTLQITQSGELFGQPNYIIRIASMLVLVIPTLVE